MVDGGGVSFSVVYADGVTESNLGEVTVDSSFNFNKFLSFLSQKIGISPHQFSVYLATFGTNRRIPINGKVNFSEIARNAAAASSFFFVKRSKRPRRSRPRSKGSPRSDNSHNTTTSPPESVVLLRRDAVAPFSGKVPGWAEYQKRVKDLQMEKDRYLIRMGIRGTVCKECLTGVDDGFHRCVYDPVTVGFRSPAGPVARPAKGSGRGKVIGCGLVYGKKQKKVAVGQQGLPDVSLLEPLKRGRIVPIHNWRES